MTDSLHPNALRALERFDEMFPETEKPVSFEARAKSDSTNTADLDDPGKIAPVHRLRNQTVVGPWTLGQTHNVDCLEGLKGLPSECLDVVITSPPYWGQRGNG